ncbi:MAG: haloacid dehalogenase-like hydrolase [Candidatus Sericytochromatia bacterium]
MKADKNDDAGMRIGLDFDNTLISYDRLFQGLVREQELLPEPVPANKTAIRDALRARGREADWTRLQGLAYGPRIDQAEAFPGMADCLRHWRGQGWELLLVSHKTRVPYAGEPHDLHAAARGWIEARLEGLLSGVYFELSRAAKLARIAKLGLDAYIDDLPDILLDLADVANPLAPVPLRLILFDPHGQYPDHYAYERWPRWPDSGKASGLQS